MPKPSYRVALLALVVIVMCRGANRCPAAEKDGSQANRQGIEFFEKKIRPVLVKHCYQCHAADAKKIRGGLLLDTRAGVLQGGDSGPAVTPGKPEESLLIKSIRYDGFEMPPKGPLPAAVVADFVKWVKLGAPDPRDGDAKVKTEGIDLEKARQFWAFQPPRRQRPPEVLPSKWPETDIDRFVLAKLQEHELAPVADADRRTLIRRLTFDLTGLPPTPEEIHAFLHDESPRALEHVVDRLLASPHFGEHWGRHWLDVARYADSNGGDINLTFHNAWRYRDYVINAFNNDKPFDQFIVEQLAGDLLPADNDAQRKEQLVASGFLIVGPKMLSERDKEKLYMDVVDEQLDSIGRAFLGLTLGCARCHDHKFDPIPTRDYYSLAGILRSTITVQGIRMNNVNVSGWIERALPIKPQHAAALAKHGKALAGINKQLAAAKAALAKVKSPTIFQPEQLPGVVVDDTQAKRVGTWKKSTHVSRYVGAGYVHDDKQGKGEKSITFIPKLPKAGEYEVRISYAGGGGRDVKVPVTVRHAEGETRLEVNQTKLPAVNKLFQPLGRFRFVAGTSGSVTIETAGTTNHVIADAAQFIPVELVKKGIGPSADLASAAVAKQWEQEVRRLEQQLAAIKRKAPSPAPMTMAPQDRDKPADCEICVRGEPHNRGPSVRRGFLSVLGGDNQPTIDPAQSGRVELARWVASRDNPLTARVIVNRLWHHLFGAGLVRSVDNFGRLGERPSHPKLLDHLAIEFLQDGRSIKKTIRKIVLSRVYRLSARHDERTMKLDPQNRLLWRHNRRRLPAESIRDAILTASGALVRTAGGSAVTGLGEQAIANNPNDKTGELAIAAHVRRSVYLPLVRNDLPDVLTVFDFADPDVVVGARSVTTVPAQALFMMNSRFVKHHAGRLARSALLAEESADDRLDWIYERAIGRLPDDTQRNRATNYIQSLDATEKAWANFCHALLASTEFRYLE